MTRRTWLIATMAALFAVQSPLCAFACVDGPEIESTTAEAPMPCHEQSSRSSVPGDTGSNEDCSSCAEATYEALASAPELNATAVLLAAMPMPVFTQSSQPSPRFATPAAEASDLPPPDILLLKTTLLI